MPKPPPNMPCVRTCPNRKPGCYCEAKQMWDIEQQAKKDFINQKKAEDNAVYGVLKPNTPKRRER